MRLRAANEAATQAAQAVGPRRPAAPMGPVIPGTNIPLTVPTAEQTQMATAALQELQPRAEDYPTLSQLTPEEVCACSYACESW